LPLLPSAFYALWAESFPPDIGRPWGVLWLADPRDIGSRQEVLRFERDVIAEATLSPDGRKLALVSSSWDWKTFTLWVANVEGTDLRQLEQAAVLRGLSWSRDSRLLAYDTGWREDVMMPGKPVPITVVRGAIELVDITTGEKRWLLEPGLDTPVNTLGWSADGRELYYSLSVPREIGYEYEIWAVSQSGQNAHRIISLGNEPGSPVLSPDGSKFLIGTPQGLIWMSADGRTQQNIPLPPWNQWCGLIWSPAKDEVIICQVDDQRPIEHIRALNIQTGASSRLSSLALRPDGKSFGPLYVSPDKQWMVTYVYNDGFYWIHLPTGAVVPIPSQNRRILFVAWVYRGVAR
jgi:hypothetical protein